jgi:hypothetical protein
MTKTVKSQIPFFSIGSNESKTIDEGKEFFLFLKGSGRVYREYRYDG